MAVVSMLNQKGGVGKTALTVGVAGALVARGRTVLVVDVDPQGHLTTTALRMARIPVDQPSLALALAGQYAGPTKDLVVTHTEHAGGRLDVLPTSTRMFSAPRDLDRRADRERQLARLLEELEGVYDCVLLDPPPALDILTDNILAAVEKLIIPVQPDDSSIEALRLLLAQVRGLERELRRDRIDILGLVLSAYRTPLSVIDRTVVEQLETTELPIIARVPLAAAIKEAQRSGIPLPLHQPGHPRVAQYQHIADLLDSTTQVSS